MEELRHITRPHRIPTDEQKDKAVRDRFDCYVEFLELRSTGVRYLTKNGVRLNRIVKYLN